MVANIDHQRNAVFDTSQDSGEGELVAHENERNKPSIAI
jgi:hypothetical protein